MAKKTYNYKNKNVIISFFNESQLYYKKYIDLKDGNPVEAQKELNIAGNKLQQTFELGLKYYLSKRYRELFNEGKLSWKEQDKLVKVIEIGRQNNNQMVDIRYLYNQMNSYASPNINESGIDFDLIRRNAHPIYNDNKHNGNDIEIAKYENLIQK